MTIGEKCPHCGLVKYDRRAYFKKYHAERAVASKQKRILKELEKEKADEIHDDKANNDYDLDGRNRSNERAEI